MLLNGTINPVETSADVQSRSFKILASRKAFEILSSGLYSHKIKAIVRELGTNAADAHTAAGNDAPFEVTLPNGLFAYFEVKDFGTGLSDNDIQNLYTTYFDSNKTSSNAFTGCLGLGSKSPFSYTDSFTVESRYNGTKTTYTAYLDTHGIPAVSKMTEEDTDEPNGLTVRIPVQADDFHEFEQECRSVYYWFKTRPVIHGDFNGGYCEFTTLFEGDGYTIGLKEQVSYQYATGVLVMGNVAYPLDFAKVSSLHKWRNYGLVLYADIGAVEIAASREALSYDERTLVYLNGRAAELDRVLPVHATTYVADAPTLWEARVRLHRLQQLLIDLEVTATWAGKPLTVSVKVQSVEVAGLEGKTNRIPEVDLIEYHWGYGRRTRRSGVLSRKHYVRDLDRLFPDNQVWLADIKNWKNALAGVLNQGQTVYVITSVTEGSDFLTRTGLDTVINKVSEIPTEKHIIPPKAKAAKVARVPVYEFRPNEDGDSGNINACAFWKRVDQTPARGVYVVIERFTPRGESNRGILYTHRLLADLGHKVTLYGVRLSDLNKLGKEWKTFDAYTREVWDKLNKTMAQEIATNAYATSNGVPEAVRGFRDRPKAYTPVLKRLGKKHPFRTAVEAVLAGGKVKRSDTIKRFLRLTERIGETSPTESKTSTPLAVQCDKLVAMYPLIQHISLPKYGDGYKDASEALLQYIKLIDAQGK